MSRLSLGRRVALVPIFLAAAFLCSCDKKQEGSAPVRPVLTMVVEPKSGQVFGPFVGSVEPRYKTDLGFRAGGRMVSRNANVGDRVTKGELLASLDPTVAQFNLLAAKADLTNSQAQLSNATGTEQRKSTLLQTGSAPQADVDSAVASKDTAQAKVNQAQAALVKAKEQVDYTELHSDNDGVITNWSLEVGQVVTAGQTVVTVARPDVRDGVFDVPDSLISEVKPGGKFTVALQADTAITATGEVREVSPQSDAATRTRRVRLTLVDVPEVFRLGTTVTITLSGENSSIITLPASAILDRDGTSSVWLATGTNTAQGKPVVLGDRQGDTVTVTKGLARGDRVIVAGVHSLSDGQPIKLEP